MRCLRRGGCSGLGRGRCWGLGLGLGIEGIGFGRMLELVVRGEGVMVDQG